MEEREGLGKNLDLIRRLALQPSVVAILIAQYSQVSLSFTPRDALTLERHPVFGAME